VGEARGDLQVLPLCAKIVLARTGLRRQSRGPLP